MNDTKKSSHGGRRQGAGRRSLKETLGLESLLADAITSDEWIEIFNALKIRAKRGDTTAAKLIMAYAFGEPNKRIEIDGSTEAPFTVRIIRASDARPDNQ